MAALVTTALAAMGFGAVFGAFLKLGSAIRREDRITGSLRRGALSPRDRTVRSVVGAHSSGWD